jgi:hypothetical protein
MNKTNSYFALILTSILLFSCDNNRPKSTGKKTIKSKNNVSVVKRKSDPTKIAFGDIEFGMSVQDLLNTQTFRSKSSKDLETSRLEDSYVMKHILESNNIPESLLGQENIIRENDIQSIEIIDKIGLFKYNIKVILVKNSISLVKITPRSENEGLENIVKVISLKYGNPIMHKKKELLLTKAAQEKHNSPLNLFCPTTIDCKEIPKANCIYEWKSTNKNIKIYYFYFTKNDQNSDMRFYVLSDYVLEIYSDKVLLDIVTSFKSGLRNNENNRNKIKAKDSEKF